MPNMNVGKLVAAFFVKGETASHGYILYRTTAFRKSRERSEVLAGVLSSR
jgi:hypothetical protein